MPRLTPGAFLIMTTFTEQQEKFANDIMLAIKAQKFEEFSIVSAKH